MSSHKRIKGLPPGYSEKDIPQAKTSFKPKAMSKDQSDMIYTLLEMPGNKPRPKAKA
jgi:hypothetical protein